MKPLFIVFFLIAIVSLSNCKKSRVNSAKQLKYFNNFEQISGWNNYNLDYMLSNQLSSDGKFSCQTDSINMYSLGLGLKLKDITKIGLKNVTISSKVYPEKGASATFVIQIFKGNTKDTTLFWYGLESKTVLKEEQKWSEMKQTIELPTLPASSRIFIYFWNTGKQPFYIDEFSVVFLEK